VRPVNLPPRGLSDRPLSPPLVRTGSQHSTSVGRECLLGNPQRALGKDRGNPMGSILRSEAGAWVRTKKGSGTWHLPRVTQFAGRHTVLSALLEGPRSNPLQPSALPRKHSAAYLRKAERAPARSSQVVSLSSEWVSASRVLRCVPTRRRPFGFTMNKPGRSNRLPFFRSDVKAWPIKGSILNRISVVETLYWPSRSNFGFPRAPILRDARERVQVWLWWASALSLPHLFSRCPRREGVASDGESL